MNRHFGFLALLSLFFTVSLAGCPSDPDPEGGEGQACRADGSCDASLVCLGGTCQVGSGQVCDGVDCSGHGSCRDDAGSAVCDCSTGYSGADCVGCDTAAGYYEDPPGSGTCVLSTCADPGCIDGATRCEDAANLSTCVADCWGAPEACPGVQVCEGGGCLDVICNPGEMGCADPTTPELCNASGTAFDPLPACLAGWVCGPAGTCLSPCDIAVADPSELGCNFVAVDLDQLDDTSGGLPSAAAGTFSLVIANPHPTLTAMVAVTGAGGAPVTLASPAVPPAEHRTFDLPRQDVDGTDLSENIFRVSTDLPVSVSQLNPKLATSFSTDASLLLPIDHLDTEYWLLSWPTYALTAPQTHAYLAIVAVEAGTTQVTVTSPVELEAGAGLPGVLPATPTSFDLQEGQVLSLQTTQVDGADPTGLHLQATANVAVFSGHEAALVPTGSGFLDHLEEQLLPVSRWATHHVAAKAPPRGTEVDVWRILAAEANTTVTTSPQQAGTPVTLGAGEFLELATSDSFEILAGGPILVAQYLVGTMASGVPNDPACAGGATGKGDPAMTLLPGVDHWRDSYVLPALSTLLDNTLTLISPAGNVLSLGGPPLPPGAWMPVGTGAYEMTYVVLTPGTRILTAAQPFGVLQHGLGCDAARAWPGGFDLSPR